MEIRVLRSFLEAAREGNMTRAAERLYLSQPTISKQIRELEEELGAKLFVRSNYSVRLTEAGMLLKERAEDILSLLQIKYAVIVVSVLPMLIIYPFISRNLEKGLMIGAVKG